MDGEGDGRDSAGGGDGDAWVDRVAAGEGDVAVGELETGAGEAVGAADDVGRAGHDRAGRGAADAKVGRPFGLQPHAGYEHLVIGADAKVEVPDAGGRSPPVDLLGPGQRLAFTSQDRKSTRLNSSH